VPGIGIAIFNDEQKGKVAMEKIGYFPAMFFGYCGCYGEEWLYFYTYNYISAFPGSFCNSLQSWVVMAIPYVWHMNCEVNI
jgi:hypothetical protein